MHFAVSHQTAAEIIYNRANSEKKHMGLTSWKKSPNGKIMESDVIIAKNYLNKEELIAQLNINDDRANEIYDVIMEFVSSKIKEKKSNMLLNRMIRVDQKIFALFMT